MAEIRSPIISVYNVSDGKDGNPSIGYKLVVDHQVHIGAQMAADDYIEIQLLQSLGTETVPVKELNSTYLKVSYADTTLNDDLIFVFGSGENSHIAKLTCKKTVDKEGNTVGTWHNSDIIINAYVNQVNVDTERVGYSSSTPIVEFNNDHGLLHYKANGIDKLYPDESETTTATLYVNGQAVTSGVGWTWNVLKHQPNQESCTASTDGNQCTVTAIHEKAFKGQVNCTASYAGEKYSRIFEVSRNLQGTEGPRGITYRLVIDRHVHSGVFSADLDMVVKLVKYTGTQSELVKWDDTAAVQIQARYATTSGYKFRWTKDQSETSFTLQPALGADNKTEPWKNEDIFITAQIKNELVDEECITYAALNTVTLDLDNDGGSLPYSIDGSRKLFDNAVAQSRAQLYLGEKPITSDVTYTWTVEGSDKSDNNADKGWTTINDPLSQQPQTVQVMTINAGVDTAIATCTVTYKDSTYTKQFPVSKRYQGEQGEKGDSGTSPTVYSLLVDRQVHTGLMMGANDTIQVQVRATIADSTTMIQLTSVDVEIEAKYQNKTDELIVVKPTSESTDKTIVTITTQSTLDVHQSWQNDDIMVSLKINDQLIDQERISYSGDTPILELTNDVATLLYDATGTNKVIEQNAETTAKLYVRGQAITTPIKWIINDDGSDIDRKDEVCNYEFIDDTLIITDINAGVDVVYATAFAEWNSIAYSKIFTVYKLCQGKDGEKGETGAASDITQKYIYLYYKLATIQAANDKTPSVPSNIDDIVVELNTNTEGQWAYSKGKWGIDLKTSCVLYRVMMTTITKGTDQTPTYTYSTPELCEAYDSTGMLGSQSYLDYLSITNFDKSDSFGYKDGNLYIKSTFINTDGIIVNNADNELLFAAGGQDTYKNAVKIGGFQVTSTALQNYVDKYTDEQGMTYLIGLQAPDSTSVWHGALDSDYLYVGADGIGLVHTSTTSHANKVAATNRTYLKAGELFSNAGQLGGWYFGADYLGNHQYLSDVTVGLSLTNNYDRFGADPNVSDPPRIWAGGFWTVALNMDSVAPIYKTGVPTFYVTNNGYLHSASGDIAGFFFNDQSMYNVIKGVISGGSSSGSYATYYLTAPNTLAAIEPDDQGSTNAIEKNLLYVGTDGIGSAILENYQTGTQSFRLKIGKNSYFMKGALYSDDATLKAATITNATLTNSTISECIIDNITTANFEQATLQNATFITLTGASGFLPTINNVTLSTANLSSGSVGGWPISNGVMHSPNGVYGTYAIMTTVGNATEKRNQSGYLFTVLNKTGVVFYLQQTDKWDETPLAVIVPNYDSWVSAV